MICLVNRTLKKVLMMEEEQGGGCLHHVHHVYTMVQINHVHSACTLAYKFAEIDMTPDCTPPLCLGPQVRKAEHVAGAYY